MYSIIILKWGRRVSTTLLFTISLLSLPL